MEAGGLHAARQHVEHGLALGHLRRNLLGHLLREVPPLAAHVDLKTAPAPGAPPPVCPVCSVCDYECYLSSVEHVAPDGSAALNLAPAPSTRKRDGASADEPRASSARVGCAQKDAHALRAYSALPLE